ncbi:MAG: sulfate reduction electron transfer complex DsrMKJOP subunit DsrM [Bryobacteraceae bacterium]
MVAAAIAYLGFAVFVAGMVWRVVAWARVPVPFAIALTCGQQKSLPGIRAAWLENPWTRAGAACRMALEVVAFRSLLRNSRAQLLPGPRFVYRGDRSLWVGALLFHGCLLWVLAGHLRFFLEPAPFGKANGFVDAGLLAGLAFLFLRRVLDPRLRYLTLAADYLPLALLATVAVSGLLMQTDVAAVKRFSLGLVAFHPVAPAGLGALFYIHVCAASALAASIPFTKLDHMAGVFFSPTRNLPNDSRARRHINPWLGPARVHTYAEWEDEFRDRMRAAGLPLERE